MKKIFYFFLIISLSCTNRPSYIQSYCLKVCNNTSYDVVMTFYNKTDTIEIESFIVNAKSKTLLDSTILIYDDDDGYRPGIVSGSNTAFESFGRHVLVRYKFDEIKISQLQIVDVECTDTSSLTIPCLFAISNLEEIYNKDNIKEKFYTQEYYITNQQYLLADSLLTKKTMNII